MLRPVLLALLWAAALPVQAQILDPAPSRESVDGIVLRAIYGRDGPVFSGVMRGVNAAAYPVYGAAPATLWVVTLATGEDTRPALRMTLAEAAAVGATFALKGSVRRARPYRVLAGIVPRDREHLVERPLDPNAFPSGHSALAFAVATSASLSEPRWYVVAPAMAWASSVALSRVWHGVHYPSDVLAGAVLGSGTGLAIHLLIPDGEENGSGVVPIGSVRIPF